MLQAPPDLYDLGASLQSEQSLLELHGRSGKMVGIAPTVSRDFIRSAARRTLDIAIQQAANASRQRFVSEQAREWLDTASAFDAAREHLTAALALLATGNSRSKNVSREAVEYTLSHMATRIISAGDWNAHKEWAEQASASLTSSSELLKDISEGARKFAAELAPKRQNYGEPEKHAFARVLAETWIHLTQRLPGKGSENNPFLAYFEAAWSDAGGEPTSAVQALRSVRAELAVEGIDPNRFRSRHLGG